LSGPEARKRSLQVVHALATAPLWHRVQRLALFLPNDGEVDLRALLPRAWRSGRLCCLPVLHGPRLHFVPHGPEDCLRPNRFGIPEPARPCGGPGRKGSRGGASRRRVPATSLDLVLAPLVGFDGAGNRLGMGGGYYDRTFSYLRERRIWHRPLLVGVAYELQRVHALAPRPWDVPLDGIVTERGLRLLRADGAAAAPDGPAEPE
jgi:5-formyltetrahydrofolate cyclo-ligase